MYYKEYKTKKHIYEIKNYKDKPEKYYLSMLDNENPLNGDKMFKALGFNVRMWESITSGTLKECESKLNELIFEDCR